ncbi:MAG: response regulator transcription factor [Verrucomicrobiales bacterium]|nr:response regulator transcription factor [Verrucomicrobiales bacterium]
MHYLIVDDHPMTRQAVIESLREPGDAFAEVGTGEEAIDYCDEHSPDWIIMDVKMPGRGGLFASREITTRRPDARIVVLSQYDDELMAQEAWAAGAMDFVSKDRIAQLPEILTGLLQKLTGPRRSGMRRRSGRPTRPVPSEPTGGGAPLPPDGS